MTTVSPAPAVHASFEQLRATQYRELVAAIVERSKVDDVPSLAAGVAFKIFLALFPAMFATVAIFSVVWSGAEVLELLERAEFVPDTVREELTGPVLRFVERASSGATTGAVVGILAGLWAASSAAVTLMKALTRINGVVESRSFLVQRAVALLITVALIVALVVLAVVLVAGGPLQTRILDEVLPQGSAARAWAGIGTTLGRYLAVILVVVVVFAFVYWIGPDRRTRPPFQWRSPGAVVGVVGWLVLSALFGVYVRLAGTNPVYGALGGVIVLMLWLQLSMLVLLVGAMLNAELRRLRMGTPSLPVHAGSAGTSGTGPAPDAVSPTAPALTAFGGAPGPHPGVGASTAEQAATVPPAPDGHADRRDIPWALVGFGLGAAVASLTWWRWSR